MAYSKDAGRNCIKKMVFSSYTAIQNALALVKKVQLMRRNKSDKVAAGRRGRKDDQDLASVAEGLTQASEKIDVLRHAIDPRMSPDDAVDLSHLATPGLGTSDASDASDDDAKDA